MNKILIHFEGIPGEPVNLIMDGREPESVLAAIVFIISEFSKAAGVSCEETIEKISEILVFKGEKLCQMMN